MSKALLERYDTVLNTKYGILIENLTSAERSALLNACSNGMSMDVKFYLKTVIGSATYRNTLTKTFTVSGDGIDAVLGYEEADSKVAGLFGTTDALQKGIIKGYSDVHVFANPTPYEGATIVSSSWTNGVTTLSGNDVTFTNKIATKIINL